MEDQLKHVSRPSAAADDAPKPFFEIKRNNLTLVLSITAIVLSCTSALVALIVFVSAGRHKMLNEADQIGLRADANRVLREVNTNPRSHPQLSEELAKFYKHLNYRPPEEAKLSVFERAAFGLLVEQYAVPIRDVQLKRAEVQKLIMGFNTPSNLNITFDTLICDIDPTDPACSESTGKRSDPPFTHVK